MPMPAPKEPPQFWVAVNFYALRLFLISAVVSLVGYWAHWQTVRSVVGAVELACVVAILVGRLRGAPFSPSSSGRR